MDSHFDIVVIGSGIAGLAAGIEGLRAGATVAIIEKRRHTGGNSRISDGVVAVAGSADQLAAGIDDSPEILAADMMEAGLDLNDRAWARLVAERSVDAMQWLKEAGCEFEPGIWQFGGHSRARCVVADGGGKAIIRNLVDVFEREGGTLLTDHACTGFIHDTNGLIEGLAVESAKTPSTTRISVRRGVIIAAGGFAADVDFRMDLDARLDDSVATTNLRGSTAEVMTAAVEMGAATRDLEWIQLGPWTSPDERGYGLAPSFSAYTVLPYGMLVDPATGRRFVNELDDRRVQADAMLALGQPCIGIACEASTAFADHPIDMALRSGCVESFDSIEELAARYDIDAAELGQSIAEFNAAIEQGEDSTFGKPILDGCPVLSPPYRAVRLWPKTHFTVGGIEVDASTRVLSVDGSPIPGLYAAGEVTGGTHGACRLSSVAVIECVVQGCIAGAAAASAVVP